MDRVLFLFLCPPCMGPEKSYIGTFDQNSGKPLNSSFPQIIPLLIGDRIFFFCLKSYRCIYPHLRKSSPPSKVYRNLPSSSYRKMHN